MFRTTWLFEIKFYVAYILIKATKQFLNKIQPFLNKVIVENSYIKNTRKRLIFCVHNLTIITKEVFKRNICNPITVNTSKTDIFTENDPTQQILFVEFVTQAWNYGNK